MLNNWEKELTKSLVKGFPPGVVAFLIVEIKEILAQQRKEFMEIVGEDIQCLDIRDTESPSWVNGKLNGINQAKQEIRDKIKEL